MNKIHGILTTFLLVGLLAASNAAVAQLSLDMVEASGAPTGYKTYDFFADVTTDMGPIELMLQTYHPGGIYQNAAAPDDPNEAYASYVTIGPSGPNEPLTQIFGGAVDLGGGASATFNNDVLDIAWLPTSGTLTGAGQRQVARVTLTDDAFATWNAIAWESGSDTPATLSGTITGKGMSLSLVEVGGAPSGYKTYDFFADVTTDMAPMELMLQTYHAGDIYQNAAAPDDPNEAYASYVTVGPSGPNASQTQVLGGAVDMGGGASVTFNNDALDIAWMPTGGTMTGNGQFQVARVTFHEKAQVTYSLKGWQAEGDTPVSLSGTIDSPISISMVEVTDPGVPAGYKAYNVIADVSTDMAPMELMLQTYHAGDIYQNGTAPDDPNEAYASYVTVGPSGPNASQTQVLGGAVDMGGGASVTFNSDALDIAWMPTGGTMTGRGQFQVARVVLHEKAQATWTVKGWQAGTDTPDSLSGTIDSPLSISMVEVTDPGAPVGYTAYDFIADVSTDMAPLELMLDTDTLGDIYQNSLIPQDAAEEFDTYITIGPSGENPAQTQVLGGAVDLGGGAGETFDTQNIDIAWMPTSGTMTGRGLFQIARVVLKNSASGSWSLMGCQAGVNGDVPFTLSADFGLPGDVNGDGFVGGGDLNAVLSNWGMSGARRSQGDLTGEGDVGGADYNQVLGNWGSGTPPEPPGSIPEPATMVLLALAGTTLLASRRRSSEVIRG